MIHRPSVQHLIQGMFAVGPDDPFSLICRRVGYFLLRKLVPLGRGSRPSLRALNLYAIGPDRDVPLCFDVGTNEWY